MAPEATAARRAPGHPTELPRRSWWRTLKRSATELRDDNLTDWAAALTYYAVLALFPALIVLVAILGLLGQDPKTTDALFQILRDSGASGSTIAVVLALVLVAIVITGPLAKGVGNAIGLGDTAVAVWNIAKWPVLVAVVMGLVASLYWLAPNVRQPKVRWISPGGVVAVVLWAVATAGFFFYVNNFGSYNKTYGTIAGMIVLLVWVWLSNIALLFGAEFDAERERSRELDAGVPAEEFIQLPPREPADDEHPDRLPDPATEQRIE